MTSPRKNINKTTGDASKILNFVNRSLRRAPPETKSKAYKALVRPKLEFICFCNMGFLSKILD